MGDLLGMRAKRLTCSDYQYLIDRGWRRSGTYCYKPLNDVTCCPCYTIRCDAIKFRPSRSHRRLLRMICSFLLTGDKPRKARTIADDWRSDPPFSTSRSSLKTPLTAKGDIPIHVSHTEPATTCCEPFSTVHPPASKEFAAGDSDSLPVHHNRRTSGLGKSRARRWDARLKRMKTLAIKQNRPFEELLSAYNERRRRRLEKNAPKELEHFFNLEPKPGEKAEHHLEVRLVRSCPPSAEFQYTLEVAYRVFRKYQTVVHNEDPDDCDMESFKRFLIKSPLVPDSKSQSSNSSEAVPFGSYHQQYWLDGDKLIAVGVVDLLPRCLSSVYLFYDPDYAFLQLGTYSALREIGFVRDLVCRWGPRSPSADLRYANFDSYYMGFFIRSCLKMAYKAQFRPSFLACPVTYTWVPIDVCLRRLDASPNKQFCRFSDATSADESVLPAADVADSLDRRIICRVHTKTQPREERRVKSSTPSAKEHDTYMYGAPISLERLKLFLSPTGLSLIREWAGLVGQRALTGQIQIVFS